MFQLSLVFSCGEAITEAQAMCSRVVSVKDLMMPASHPQYDKNMEILKKQEGNKAWQELRV